MMFFFPEIPYKSLGYKSSLMSASTLWTSFLLKNYCQAPGWFHDILSVTDWELSQSGLPACRTQGSSDTEAEPGMTWSVFYFSLLKALVFIPGIILKT